MVYRPANSELSQGAAAAVLALPVVDATSDWRIGRYPLKRSRRVLGAAALGAITPAVLLEQGARAHAAHQTGMTAIQNGAPSIGPGHEAMKSALLTLSPADKLRIGGDRIRLAGKFKAPQAKPGKGSQGMYVLTKRKTVNIPCEYVVKKKK